MVIKYTDTLLVQIILSLITSIVFFLIYFKLIGMTNAPQIQSYEQLKGFKKWNEKSNHTSLMVINDDVSEESEAEDHEYDEY